MSFSTKKSGYSLFRYAVYSAGIPLTPFITDVNIFWFFRFIMQKKIGNGSNPLMTVSPPPPTGGRGIFSGFDPLPINLHNQSNSHKNFRQYSRIGVCGYLQQQMYFPVDKFLFRINFSEVYKKNAGRILKNRTC
jgi:hypothetical protein